MRLAQQASDALTEISALYYRGLLEIWEGNPKAGRQTLAKVLASFTALNSPEANKVATFLAELDAPGGIDVIKGDKVAKARIDVIKGGRAAVKQNIDVSKKGSRLVNFPDIDVVRKLNYESSKKVKG
jgi:hypothetical protein